ncbi:MAG: response regulator [Oscillospiraceae bacterium]|nr:response regulator [Oscillospiraceae bacterium]
MRIIICDDNQADLECHAAYIKKAADELNEPLELKKFNNASQVIFALEDSVLPVDAVFLDLRMPDIDGIKLAKDIRGYGYRNSIVFLTGSDVYWRSGYEIGALNYMIKGEVTQEKINDVVGRIAQESHALSAKYISVTSGGQTHNIRV